MDNKGNTDDNVGTVHNFCNTMTAFVKLEVEAGCFPRFRHYQHSIGSIFSRFKDMAERKCLLRDIVGETIKELGLKVKDIEQSPIVVVGPGLTKCPPLSEFLVSSDPYRSTKHASTFNNGESFCIKSDDLSHGKGANKQFTKPTYTSTSSNARDVQHPRPKAEKHSLAALIQEGDTLSVDTPYVIVLLEEASQSLNDEYPGFMKNITDNKISKIILNRVKGDKGFRSSSKRNGQVNHEDCYKSELVCMDNLENKFDSLSNAIQHSFETKAVRILEILFELLQPQQSMLEGIELCVETSQDMNIQLYHEVLALLRKTKVKVVARLPEKQTIPPKLQDELARITNVTGCGLIFGRLTVMVASNTSYNELHRLKATVATTLSGHNYEGYVDIHRGEMIPSSHQIKPGQKIRATSEEVRLIGTLGGFVIGTQAVHTSVTEEATSTVAKQEKHLFGLTCAHCVDDATIVDAIIDQNNTLLIRNTTIPILKENGINIDIAAICINKDVEQNNCQHPCLRDVDGNETRADILQDTHGLVSGQAAFMWVGSELREGVIGSDQSFMENGNPESIIIYPQQQTPFSNAGDSGGIVCVCAETGAPITAISILIGMMTKPKVSENSENVNTTDQEQIYSYSQSYSLKKNIEALETNNQWRFALPVPGFVPPLDDIDALCTESSGQQEILDGPLGAEGGPIIEGENDEVDETNESTASPQDQTQANNDNEDSILDDRQCRRQEYDENQEQIQFQTTDDNGASSKIPNVDTNEDDDLEVDGCISLDASTCISKHDVVERTYTSRHVSVAMPTGYYFRKQTDCTIVYA